MKAVLLAAALVCATVLSGCSTCSRSADRPFVLGRDNFAFTNGLMWTYEFGTNGLLITRKNDPPPRYSHRCFPMNRTVREFFYHARFAPELPKAEPQEYHELAREMAERNSRCPSAPEDRIVIPGYPDLFSFSAEHSAMLRQVCGGPAWSYLQRGNWRMIFPLARSRMRKTALHVAEELRAGRLPIVHVYRFPEVKLNHGLLLFQVEDAPDGLRFKACDPNIPDRPVELRFDTATDTFIFERNLYFEGGPVRVYEVYASLLY